MGSWLRKSLYLALFWRIAVGIAVMAAATLLLPRWWMVIGTGLVVALWIAAWVTSVVTNAIELIEPAAATVAGRDSRWPEAPFRQMEPLVHALHVSAAEVVRQLEASSESRRKLEALLDSMQDAVTSVDGAGRIVWANVPMQKLVAESSGSVRAGHSLVQTIRSPRDSGVRAGGAREARVCRDAAGIDADGQDFCGECCADARGRRGRGDAGYYPGGAGGAHAERVCRECLA